MASQIPSPIVLPAAADFHVHLRDGLMSLAVAPTVRPGGVNTAYVMPNLVPPVTTVPAALAYRERLLAASASAGGNNAVDYLMTLYLSPSTTTPAVVREAAASGIVRGIKSYPQGVTTNSSEGVVGYDEFFDVFAEMERVGLVLNLHGEVPPQKGADTTVLNAESRFLPTLKMLHERFPKLRIVLEHCTSQDAVEAVRACGDTVVGTITAHHLFLTVDDWAADVHCYCKPVAKTPADRLALLQAVVGSGGKFFLGTDSAPHPVEAKKGPGKTAAGVFTQPHAVGLVLTALDEAVERGDVEAADVTQAALEGFLGGYGRRFYGVAETEEKIRLTCDSAVIGAEISAEREGEAVRVVPFRAGLKTWGVEWLAAGDA